MVLPTQAFPPFPLPSHPPRVQGAASLTRNELRSVPQRVLAVVGRLDFVVPSAQEGPRLKKELPRCQLRTLPFGSHALLQVRPGRGASGWRRAWPG